MAALLSVLRSHSWGLGMAIFGNDSLKALTQTQGVALASEHKAAAHAL